MLDLLLCPYCTHTRRSASDEDALVFESREAEARHGVMMLRACPSSLAHVPARTSTGITHE